MSMDMLQIQLIVEECEERLNEEQIESLVTVSSVHMLSIFSRPRKKTKEHTFKRNFFYR